MYTWGANVWLVGEVEKTQAEGRPHDAQAELGSYVRV